MLEKTKKHLVSCQEVLSAQRGATLVEYVMIAAVIGLGLVAILTPLRAALTAKISEIVNAITGAGS